MLPPWAHSMPAVIPVFGVCLSYILTPLLLCRVVSFDFVFSPSVAVDFAQKRWKSFEATWEGLSPSIVLNASKYMTPNKRRHHRVPIIDSIAFPLFGVCV